MDDIDRYLKQLLAVRQADGELSVQVRLWELRSSRAVGELVDIACGRPVSKADTPHLYGKLCDKLFVGFAHNLLLESLVSRLSMLERQHPHTHAITLDETFKYHMAQADARADRLSPDMRSLTKGARRKAAREKAEEGKPLTCTNRSYKQQAALAADALRCARRYTNHELFSKQVQ